MFSTAAVTAGTLVATGFCLGLGFWACKKITNYVDMKLAMRDPQMRSVLMDMGVA